MAYRAFLACMLACLSAAQPNTPPEKVAVRKDGAGFVLTPSGAPFTPWGFNQDRDYQHRLLEDYWSAEWPTVERDFREMRKLGANLVRIDLQFASFMDAPGKPNAANLARLEKLVQLAEGLGLYLDITGLGSYREKDVPAWYGAMPEGAHWAAQAQFWEAIAKTCAGRPGVFAYNLMNEPVVSSDRRLPGAWLHPSELGGLHYLEYINLDPAGRKRTEIAQRWIRQMTLAIRKYDARSMVTVGMVLLNLRKPEEEAGFPPSKIAPELDFLAIHMYPEKDKLDTAIETLTRYRKAAGKPVLIEETYPLRCSVPELRAFIERSRSIASGYPGFYWGQTPEQLKDSTKPGDLRTLRWLELFRLIAPDHRQ
ncbi:MAG: cellulase family glycosylhydrolase [Bryobacteraceae bacterium]|jgi:hypothetical protein